MNWLKQPSTWRGIFLFAGLFGWHLHPELQDALVTAILAALALIEVIRNEHAPTPVSIQLPSIELIGKPDAGRADGCCGAATDRVRPVAVQSVAPVSPEPAPFDGSFNG